MSQTAQQQPVQPAASLAETAQDARSQVGGTLTPPQTDKAAPTADPRLEQLTRKERLLTKQMQQFRAEREAFAKEKAQAEAERSSRLAKDEWKAKFLEDPTALGVGYDEIRDRFLKQPSPEEQREIEIKREIESLRMRQEEADKKQAEAQKAAYDSAKKQIAREVNSLVSSSQEWALVQAQGATDAVVDLIEATYQEEGTLMTTQEALQEVETYLMQQAESLLKLDKIKAKLMPAAPEAATSTPAPTQSAKPGRVKHTITVTPKTQATTTTLTHAMSQASTRPVAGSMTPRERAIAAIEAMRANRK